MTSTSNAEDIVTTPISVLWDGILSVPIIGVIDSIRSQQIMDDILARIQETGAKVMILDILGVPAVDSAVASHLIKITKATKLLGCRCIVSGISPVIAQTMVHLGIELGEATTVATLGDALATAFDHIDLAVVPAGRRLDSVAG